MSDGVPFQNIPSTLRTPLFYAEVSNSQANTGQQQQTALIIGQMLAGGAATPGVATPAVASDGVYQCGAGSQIDLMIRSYRRNDPYGPLWILPLDDDGTATAASGGFVFTGAATAAGTIYAYVGQQLVTVAVIVGMTAAQVATALYTAINALGALPVTATNGTPGTTTVAAKNKGLVGNDIQLAVNLLGYQANQVVPTGLAVTITVMSGGAVNPSLTTALAGLGDRPFDFIASPYTDATSITAIGALLNDTAGRWSWNEQVYGHHFTAFRGTFGALTTEGAGLNDPHLTMMGAPASAPDTMMEWAAAIAGEVAVSVRADPALPLQTLVLQGIGSPATADLFTLSERESLLYGGISTFTVDAAGAVAISLLITTYQRNAFGQADDSYLHVETLFTLMSVLRSMAGIVTSKFACSKLAADGTRFAPGSNIVTPSTIKATIVAAYRDLEFQGLVQGSDVFAANLIVVQNPTNPNRVDVLWPAILINQLNIFALLAQFRLSPTQFAPSATDASASLA